MAATPGSPTRLSGGSARLGSGDAIGASVKQLEGVVSAAGGGKGSRTSLLRKLLHCLHRLDSAMAACRDVRGGCVRRVRVGGR